MEIFNATNLVYIMGGFVKTIEISALSIVCSVILARCSPSSRPTGRGRFAGW